MTNRTLNFNDSLFRNLSGQKRISALHLNQPHLESDFNIGMDSIYSIGSTNSYLKAIYARNIDDKFQHIEETISALSTFCHNEIYNLNENLSNLIQVVDFNEQTLSSLISENYNTLVQYTNEQINNSYVEIVNDINNGSIFNVDEPLHYDTNSCLISLNVGKGLQVKDNDLRVDSEWTSGQGAVHVIKGISDLADFDVMDLTDIGLGFAQTAYELVSGGDAQLHLMKIDKDDFTQEGGKLSIKSKGMDRIPYYSALNGFSTYEGFEFHPVSSTLEIGNVQLNPALYGGDYAATYGYVNNFVTVHPALSGLTYTDIGAGSLKHRELRIDHDDITLKFNLDNELCVSVGKGLVSDITSKSLAVQLSLDNTLAFDVNSNLKGNYLGSPGITLVGNRIDLNELYCKSLITSADPIDLSVNAGVITCNLTNGLGLLKVGNVFSLDSSFMQTQLAEQLAAAETTAIGSGAASAAVSGAATAAMAAGGLAAAGQAATLAIGTSAASGLLGAVGGALASIFGGLAQSSMSPQGVQVGNNNNSNITIPNSTESGSSQIKFNSTDSSILTGIYSDNDFTVQCRDKLFTFKTNSQLWVNGTQSALLSDTIPIAQSVSGLCNQFQTISQNYVMSSDLVNISNNFDADLSELSTSLSGLLHNLTISSLFDACGPTLSQNVIISATTPGVDWTTIKYHVINGETVSAALYTWSALANSFGLAISRYATTSAASCTEISFNADTSSMLLRDDGSLRVNSFFEKSGQQLISANSVGTLVSPINTSISSILTNPVITNLTATNLKSSNICLNGTSFLELGYGLTKEVNAGRIGYGTWDAGWLGIVGCGTSTGTRGVKIYDNLYVENAISSNSLYSNFLRCPQITSISAVLGAITAANYLSTTQAGLAYANLTTTNLLSTSVSALKSYFDTIHQSSSSMYAFKADISTLSSLYLSQTQSSLNFANLTTLNLLSASFAGIHNAFDTITSLVSASLSNAYTQLNSTLSAHTTSIASINTTISGILSNAVFANETVTKLYGVNSLLSTATVGALYSNNSTITNMSSTNATITNLVCPQISNINSSISSLLAQITNSNLLSLTQAALLYGNLTTSNYIVSSLSNLTTSVGNSITNLSYSVGYCNTSITGLKSSLSSVLTNPVINSATISTLRANYIYATIDSPKIYNTNFIGTYMSLGNLYFTNCYSTYGVISHVQSDLLEGMNAIATKITTSGLTSNGDIIFNNPGSTGNRGVYGTMANNDYWYMKGFGSSDNDGYLEISTGDDGTEPIYVSQRGSTVRTLTLLDGNGNTIIPGILQLNGGGYISQSTYLEFGRGKTKEANAGRIGYETFTPGALDIIGAGTIQPRIVKIWDTLNVNSSIYANGIGCSYDQKPAICIVTGTETIGPSSWYNVGGGAGASASWRQTTIFAEDWGKCRNDSSVQLICNVSYSIEWGSSSSGRRFVRVYSSNGTDWGKQCCIVDTITGEAIQSGSAIVSIPAGGYCRIQAMQTGNSGLAAVAKFQVAVI